MVGFTCTISPGPRCCPILKKNIRRNLNRFGDSVLWPQETLALAALCCSLKPEPQHSISASTPPHTHTPQLYPAFSLSCISQSETAFCMNNTISISHFSSPWLPIRHFMLTAHLCKEKKQTFNFKKHLRLRIRTSDSCMYQQWSLDKTARRPKFRSSN